MSAPPPYAINDPYKQNVGWGAQPSPYPTDPNGAYPTQPAYPAQPYPAQPAYPAQPYPAQPGFPPQGGAFPGPGIAAVGMARPGMNIHNASGGGGAYQPSSGASNEPKLDNAQVEGFGGSFDSQMVRHAFIRKVMLILMSQLLVTLGFIALFTFHEGVKYYVQRNLWVYFTSYAVFLVTYITLVCCSGVRRKYPANFIMLGIFTLALSYMTGTISSVYDTRIVFMAVGITAVICFLLALFAVQTKWDFTGWHTYLFVIGMALFIFGLVALFTRMEILQTIYSAGIALLFSMYLVYDVQMLVGGRKYELSPEEHIFGAMTIYIDVIQIFLAILSLSKD